MCPVCLTTAAFIAAGTGAATGLTALVLGRCRTERPAPLPDPTPSTEEK